MQRANIFSVYILTNQVHTVLYIGVTNNLIRRISEHREGKIPGFTKQYNVFKLIYCEHFGSIEYAIEREKQLKKWRREKKIWLIEQANSEWRDLFFDISADYNPANPAQ